MDNQSLGFVTLGDIPLPRLLELARLADRAGLSSVWIADEPFFRGAIPTAAACAVVTERIRLGLGIVNPYDHPPVWMAKDFGTLQELAGERMVLGIGASWRPPIEAQGIPWTKPLSAVSDTVHIVRELLAGGTSHHQGGTFQTTNITLNFQPPLADSVVHMASMFPKSLAQAGAIADGVIISILCPVPYIRKAKMIIRDAATGVGRDPNRLEIVQYVPMEVSEDGESARRSIKRHLAFFIKHSYGSDPEHWVKVAELGTFDVAEFAAIYERVSAGDRPEEVIEDHFVDRFGVAGTPSHCLDILAQYKEAGTTEAVALFPPWANLEEQVRVVAERLVPEWQHL
jgi:5,10-methylenetetrahydromethanopterin reductase